MENSLKEKKAVALSSVIASFFLTAGKLAVGILTGSLGILSEAAHSAMDFGAAIITYFAVRVSDKPADEEHHYGHAKVENISALIEAALLFITCAWIIKEAVNRLFFKSESIEITIWSFLVIIVSIVVDFSRSRALSRAAKKYKSQALEADALHFSSDILSSLVVLVGLVFAKFGIMNADPLAAFVVAVIVIFASWRLARRTIDALLDTAPAGLDRQIADEVMEIPGVAGVHKVRLRQSGGYVQGDLHIVMQRNVSFVDGHKIATMVEHSLAKYSSDIVVHFEPQDDWDQLNEAISEKTNMVENVLNRYNFPFHELQVSQGPNGLIVSIHVTLPKEISVMEARKRCDILENDIRSEMAGAAIHLRIEPCDGLCPECTEVCSKNQE